MANVRNVIEILLTAKNQLTAPVRSAGAALKKFHGRITAVSTGFLAARQAAQDVAGAFDALVGSTIREARELKAFESRLGIAADRLAQLRYVGELNNVQFNQLAMSIQRVTRRAAEAAKGYGEAQGAIKELNLDAEKFSKLGLDEAVLQLSDAFSRVEDSGDKARLAFKLFDAEGVSMLQVLGENRAEMEALMRQSVETGAAMSGELIASADQAARKLIEVKGAVTGVKNAIAEGLLAEASEADITALTEMFKSAAVFAGKTTKFSIDITGDFKESFADFSEVMEALADFMAMRPVRESLFGKDVVAEVDQMRTGLLDIRGTTQNLNRDWLALLESLGLVNVTQQEIAATAATIEAGMAKELEKAAKSQTERAEAAAKANAVEAEAARIVREFLRQQNDELERTKAIRATMPGLLADEYTELQQLSRGYRGIGREAAEGMNAFQAHLAQTGARLDGVRTKIQANTEASREWEEQLREWREQYEASLEPTPLERFTEGVEHLAKTFDETLLHMTGRFADSIGAGFARAIVYTENFHDAAKAAWKSFTAAVLTEINRIIARQIVAAVLSIFIGGGNVSKIASGIKAVTSAASGFGSDSYGGDEFGGPAMQSGGLVPGYGGGDSVPATLEPGEAVLPKELTSFLLNAARGATASTAIYQTPQASQHVHITAQTVLGGRSEALELARIIGAYMREAGAQA